MIQTVQDNTLLSIRGRLAASRAGLDVARFPARNATALECYHRSGGEPHLGMVAVRNVTPLRALGWRPSRRARHWQT